MKVKALKPFLLEKTTVVSVGDVVEMSDSRAKELITKGIVEEAKETATKAPAKTAAKDAEK
jgi:hypothetical protein